MSIGRIEIYYGLLFLCVGLWLLKIILWTTPNNVLHYNGFGDAVGTEMFFSFLVGLAVAIFSVKRKNKFSSKPLYFATLVAGAGLAVAPIALFVLAFIAVIFFDAV